MHISNRSASGTGIETLCDCDHNKARPIGLCWPSSQSGFYALPGTTMPAIDDFMKRMLGLAKGRATEEVLANGKVEVMTSTQAYRFNQLQQLGYADDGEPDLPDKPVYALEEAAQRLAVSIDDLLALAAAEKARCVIDTAGLSGNWDQAVCVPATTDATPAFLALSAASCAEIRDFGSANVTELHHDTGKGPAVFRLRTTQWVDPNRILMLHPLPQHD